MGIPEKIFSEIAHREDTSRLDLPPLYETVDPDALQDLVESADDETFRIVFSYNDYIVRIEADGGIEVSE